MKKKVSVLVPHFVPKFRIQTVSRCYEDNIRQSWLYCTVFKELHGWWTEKFNTSLTNWGKSSYLENLVLVGSSIKFVSETSHLLQGLLQLSFHYEILSSNSSFIYENHSSFKKYDIHIFISNEKTISVSIKWMIYEKFQWTDRTCLFQIDFKKYYHHHSSDIFEICHQISHLMEIRKQTSFIRQ